MPGLVQGLGQVRPPCPIPLSAPQASCCCCHYCCSWLPSPSGHRQYLLLPPLATYCGCSGRARCDVYGSILDLGPGLGMGEGGVAPWMNSPCLLCLHLWPGALLQCLPVSLKRPGAAVPGHNCKMIDCPADPNAHLKSLGIGLESILRGLNTPVLNSN